MSRVTKTKHVMSETTWNDDELPKENQDIVKVVKNMGNNLYAVITPTGEEYLVAMPTKFRRTIWVGRGTCIVVERIPNGRKVKADIVKIMNKNCINYYKEKNVWPKEFDDNEETSDPDDSDSEDSENSEDSEDSEDSENSEDSEDSENPDDSECDTDSGTDSENDSN